MSLTRREFLKVLSAGAGASALAACETPGSTSDAPAGAARVVVVGGGYGGATAAKYVKLWAPDIDVVLIERDAHFISCPVSNLVLGGNTTMQEITMGRETLRSRGVRIVRDEATAIDPARKEVRLGRGAPVRYDRLIVLFLFCGRFFLRLGRYLLRGRFLGHHLLCCCHRNLLTKS